MSGTTYNVAGLPTEMLYGNGYRVVYGYRSTDFRLSQITKNSTGGPSLNLSYTYDARGNVDSILDFYGPLSIGSTTYTYDHLNRVASASGQGISSAVVPGTPATYAYDKVGNMTSKDEQQGTTPTFFFYQTYGVGSAGPHALTSADGYDGYHTFTYDLAGNMTEEKVGGVTRHTFSYNAEGLVKARTTGGVTTNYAYDAGGTLARKYATGQQGTVYIAGIYEKNLGTGVITKYYFADGKRIAMKQGATLTYMVTDHLSGAALMMNSSNPPTEVGEVRYLPFGGQRAQAGTVATDKRYTGQQLEVNQLYYYGARMYNADIGRFLSADTIVPEPGNPQALNRYSYVLNNPVRYTDPTGHCLADMYGPRGCLGNLPVHTVPLPPQSQVPVAPRGNCVMGPYAPGICVTPTPQPRPTPITPPKIIGIQELASDWLPIAPGAYTSNGPVPSDAYSIRIRMIIERWIFNRNESFRTTILMDIGDLTYRDRVPFGSNIFVTLEDDSTLAPGDFGFSQWERGFIRCEGVSCRSAAFGAEVNSGSTPEVIDVDVLPIGTNVANFPTGKVGWTWDTKGDSNPENDHYEPRSINPLCQLTPSC